MARKTVAIVGPTEQRKPDNLANSATFGLVVTGEGAELMDSGGSYLNRPEFVRVL